MRTRFPVFIDGGDGVQCPHDAGFEHRPDYPYLGACVPKNLSDRTGYSPGHRQRWDPDAPNPRVPSGRGRHVWDGGCDAAGIERTA